MIQNFQNMDFNGLIDDPDAPDQMPGKKFPHQKLRLFAFLDLWTSKILGRHGLPIHLTKLGEITAKLRVCRSRIGKSKSPVLILRISPF